MKVKIKRVVMILMILVFVTAIFIYGINMYVVAVGKKNIVEKDLIVTNSQMADAIIVLGAGVRADGSLTPMLKERMDKGIQLYEQGAADCILVSGDHGSETYDEVNAMKSYAIKNGVPSERIFMDHAGFSTYETMYRARKIFQIETAFVVTQEYHMYRAVYIAEKLGIDAKGVSCDTRKYKHACYRWAREVLARNKDFWTTVFKPEPTYLGEVIPVSSDGNLTNDE